jgi:hypothetical protein
MAISDIDISVAPVETIRWTADANTTYSVIELYNGLKLRTTIYNKRYPVRVEHYIAEQLVIMRNYILEDKGYNFQCNAIKLSKEIVDMYERQTGNWSKRPTKIIGLGLDIIEAPEEAGPFVFELQYTYEPWSTYTDWKYKLIDGLKRIL